MTDHMSVDARGGSTAKSEIELGMPARGDQLAPLSVLRQRMAGEAALR
jgi:hypothetical protein